MCLCGFDFNLYEMKIDGMEPVRDRNGQVNFRYTIRRREVRERRHETRNECFAREHLNVEWLFLRSGSDIRAMNQLFDRNRRRRFPESQLSYDYCDFGMKELELPVTWLFLRRGADIRAMHQMLNMNRIRSTRDYYHRTNWEPQLHAAWLFLRRGVDVRAMHHLGMQDDDDVEEIRWDRRQRHREELERRQKERECWLLRCQEEWCMQEMKRQQEELERMIRFAHTTESARRNFLVYQQQQHEWKQRTNMGTWRCVVRREREEMRKEHREQNDPNLSWLFLHMGLDVQAMKQLIVRDDIRKIRQDWRHEVELEYELRNVQSCCECLLDIWENDEMHFLQENENVEECMPMKWMWNRGQPVKSTRGRGRKSFKRSIIPRTKGSAAKPIVRWKRRKDNLSWSQC